MYNLPLQAALPTTPNPWLSYILVFILAAAIVFLLGLILNKVYKRRDGISRPVFLSGMMSFAFVANFFAIIYTIVKYSGPIDLVSISSGMINLIGIFLMVKWKRLGFYIISAAILVFAASLSIYSHSFSNLTPILCIPVWYLLLQLKCSNGERCWKIMGDSSVL